MALSCLLSVHAFAQEASSSVLQPPAPAATNAAKTQTPTKPATGSTRDTNATTLGNVTVTAQSRTQEVQDVPIAMQIVTNKQIDAVAATDLSKMNGYIPGLYINAEQPTQPACTLRGISVSDFGIGTDSPIGIYEDGVYTGKTGGALLTFNDVQRIEVLKGPQGTLFGRNSAAGAISVVTNEPTDTLSGELRTRLGNYGMHYVDGFLNVPLNHDMAARISFVDNQSDGWLRDAATGQHYEKNDDWGMRSQFRWNAPGDNTVRVTWEHEKLNQPARPAIGLVPLPASPGVPAFPPNPNTYLDPRTAPLYNDVIGGSLEKRTFDSFTMFVDHSLSFGDLESTTAYRHFSTFNNEDGDGTNRQNLYLADINIEKNTSWEQELKLSGQTDLADWVSGLSYYHDNASQASPLDFNTASIDTLIKNVSPIPGSPNGSLYGFLTQTLNSVGIPANLVGDPWQETMYNQGTSKAYAAFGDVIWHLTSQLDLTTGIRFTRDEKQFSWYNPPRIATQLDAALDSPAVLGFLNAVGVPLSTFRTNLEFNTPASTNAPLVVSNGWTDTSPRAVLSYKPTPNVMVYGSVTKGYEAGGYNIQLPDSHYEPEIVWNYETGIKAYFPTAKILLDASIYHYRYTNLQSLTFDASGNGALPLYVVTTSDQQATGMDLEMHWQATDALQLTLTTAYIDSNYQKYVAPDGTVLSG
ncbi:MAG: TonB-dependent receptor [Rhodanobacter sp.]